MTVSPCDGVLEYVGGTKDGEKLLYLRYVLEVESTEVISGIDTGGTGK